jgi:hypothetical protein
VLAPDAGPGDITNGYTGSLCKLCDILSLREPARFARQPLRRTDRVGDEHRDRHRTDPTRHGRDITSVLLDPIEIYVTDQTAIRCPIDPDVDHRRAFLHHGRGDEIRLARRHHEDIRKAP